MTASSPVVNVDPDGEVIIVIPSPAAPSRLSLTHQDAAGKATSTIATEDDVATEDASTLDAYSHPIHQASEQDGKPSTLRLRVSKKHLAMASTRARTMYQMDCKESTHDADGFLHWEFAPLFDPAAFETVMRIIHGQTNKVPRAVTLDALAEVAAITDDLACHDAVHFVADAWLERLQRAHPTEICPDLYKWILVASVFSQPDCFRSTTRVAIMQCTGSLSPGATPVHPAIIDAIESRRRDLLGELVAEAGLVVQRLSQGGGACTFDCRSMMLGALMQEMRRAGLHSPCSGPGAPLPLPSISLSTALHRMRSFQSPAVYSPQAEVDEGRDWCEGYEADSVRAPERVRSSEGYGSSHSMSRHQYKKHRRVVSAPRGREQDEGYDGSATVFKHECCLRRLLEPLIHAMEAKITGLDVNDFSSVCQTRRAV
ncbi:het-d [Metarhizium robertsii ARSEF 23]|uniref:Het-d n=1 Tax=Metarhizium robertsii (strain ARSEF 23 / ATCC MYA-3075) TaxID=655844 RepID=A0A0B2XET0_METRA|nr:het-d [Metarhizium robertsii ARSEF 23]KHO11235.1 het-d [Metarhizium robertsii ARSEF 23]